MEDNTDNTTMADRNCFDDFSAWWEQEESLLIYVLVTLMYNKPRTIDAIDASIQEAPHDITLKSLSAIVNNFRQDTPQHSIACLDTFMVPGVDSPSVMDIMHCITKVLCHDNPFAFSTRNKGGEIVKDCSVYILKLTPKSKKSFSNMLSEDLEVQGIEFVGKLPENLIFEIDRSTPSMVGKYQKALNANAIQMTSDDEGSVVTATYSCTNIIKHYGTFATGHYVGPYCLEVKSGEWFQFVEGYFNAAEGAQQDKVRVGGQNEVAVVYIYTKG